MQPKIPFRPETISQDALASIVVFLVALPLCLGISIACGLPPTTGIISGIIGGFVVGFITGSPLQVSGPAAGLITVVWDTIDRYGIEGFGIIVLMAGLMQIMFGLLKLGKWFRAVSPAVLQGMLSGIGLLIFASQFHVMIDDKPVSSGIQNLLAIPSAIWKVFLSPEDGLTHHIAAAIGALTIVTVVLWSIVVPKRLKFIPPPLVGILVAVIAAYFFNPDIDFITVPDNLFGNLNLMSFSTLTQKLDWGFVTSAVEIAFVASAATLLTATAVDHMRTGHRSDYSKEIIAQGVGNSLAGMLGVIPLAGVIVRSSANVHAGAETKASTILHGVWLLLFVTLLSSVLTYIPVSALAAILVYTGYKLVNLKEAQKLLRFGKSELLIYLVTIFTIVSTSLLQGIVVGLILSLMKILHYFSRLDIQVDDKSEAGTIKVTLSGNASFVMLPRLADVVEDLEQGKKVVLSLEGIDYIDSACIQLLNKWRKTYKESGGTVDLEMGDLHLRMPRRKLSFA